MKDQIRQQATQALKDHNQKRVDVLRYLISLIDKRGLQLPADGMTEAEEMKVLQKELKNKEEARAMFAQGGREDLVKEIEEEIKILKEFLPEEMTDEELQKIVDEVLGQTQDSGENNFGAVMKGVMTKVAGRVGGERIAPMVKKKLAK